MKADSKSVLRKLNIAKGQLDGITRMVEEDRYCMDISTQLLASIALLKSIHTEVIEAHIRSCIRDCLVSGDEEGIDEKMDEMSRMLKKL